MEMSLSPEDELLLVPVTELASLRMEHTKIGPFELVSDADAVLDEVQGACLEIRAYFTWEDAEEFGLRVRCSGDHEEHTSVRFNTNPWVHNLPPSELPDQREVVLDVSRSSLAKAVSDRESQRCQPTVPYGATVELHVFIDRSVVEVFVNMRHYLGKRIYPSRQDSIGVEAYSVGGQATLLSLDAWRLSPIWSVSDMAEHGT